MIESLGLDEAVKLVGAIKNSQNPGAQAAAIAKRNQWLCEHELGVLKMTPEVKAKLQSL